MIYSQEKIHNNWGMGVNVPSSVTDQSSRKKYKQLKNIESIYRSIYKTAQYNCITNFFWCVHGIFNKVDHILGKCHQSSKH